MNSIKQIFDGGARVLLELLFLQLCGCLPGLLLGHVVIVLVVQVLIPAMKCATNHARGFVLRCRRRSAYTHH